MSWVYNPIHATAHCGCNVEGRTVTDVGYRPHTSVRLAKLSCSRTRVSAEWCVQQSLGSGMYCTGIQISWHEVYVRCSSLKDEVDEQLRKPKTLEASANEKQAPILCGGDDHPFLFVASSC